MTNAAVSSPPCRAFTATKPLGRHLPSSDDESEMDERVLKGVQRKRRRTLSVVKPLSPKLDSSEDETIDGAVPWRPRRWRSIVPESDKTARQRCFDYLLNGIDAVWAEYCDSTLLAESQLYMPCSPVSDYEQPQSPGESVSKQPHSVRLMQLKKRLLDSKYYMSELVSSNEIDMSSRFWKRWDAIKHAVIELVEEDDEDPDTFLDDLEDGRL